MNFTLYKFSFAEMHPLRILPSLRVRNFTSRNFTLQEFLSQGILPSRNFYPYEFYPKEFYFLGISIPMDFTLYKFSFAEMHPLRILPSLRVRNFTSRNFTLQEFLSQGILPSMNFYPYEFYPKEFYFLGISIPMNFTLYNFSFAEMHPL